jgi:hypothetical protein
MQIETPEGVESMKESVIETVLISIATLFLVGMIAILAGG